MKFIILLTIAATLGFQQFLQAQNGENQLIAKKLEPEAEEYFRIGEYSNALKLYTSLDSLVPDTPEYLYRIGLCHLNSTQKSKSIDYLERVMNAPELPDEYSYYLGRAYHLNHYFTKALVHYQSYRIMLRYGRGSEAEIAEIERLIQMCNNGQDLIFRPIRAKVINLGPLVNTIYADYAPVITSDEETMIFTSKRGDSTINKIDPSTGQFYEDIYQMHKKNGKWQKPEKIKSLVNTQEHDATVGLSPNGDQLLIYRGNNDSFVARISGDLYYSKKQDNNWSPPLPFGKNINTRAWEPSASISGDGQLLFFTSDRDEGYGGRDIYVAHKLADGSWGNVENLGPLINTPNDEDAPFIHPDGKRLYFSSTGHQSMGGFDVFVSEWNAEKKRWRKAYNVGYPVNTADDDIYFVWSEDGKRAYFSSKREDGFGDSDLYMMVLEDGIENQVAVSGFVKDDKTLKPLGAEITVRKQNDNSLLGAYEAKYDDGRFRFFVETGSVYDITVNTEGYEGFNMQIEVNQQEDLDRQMQEIYLTRLN